MVMVAGGAIFALYEVSTALSVREQRRLEAAGRGPVTKTTAKVSSVVFLYPNKMKNNFYLFGVIYQRASSVFLRKVRHTGLLGQS